MSYLKAWQATGDIFYRDAALETAQALIYGQLESGGWTNAIDFDPKGSKVAQYRNGKGRGRNVSTFDDGITQHALRFLMHLDRALDFKNPEIHEACEVARNAVLAAQFPSGAFPQGWTGPVAPHAVVKASYPNYEWRTENRIKNYWDMPTLNDGLAGDNAEMLLDAWQIYKDERFRQALTRLGDFLLLAQMPEPQPAWAQQYDTQMRPIWARRFEPASITGNESQDVLETLIFIYRATGDAKYLEPIPRALAYLKRSLLPAGQLARFYELQTNKPLYMTRDYVLTYDDSDVPTHYSWKTRSRLEAIEAALQAARNRTPEVTKSAPNAKRIQQIIESLDAQGRWMSTHTGPSQTRDPKFKTGDRFISSDLFSKNLDALSEYVRATK
jgi:PelA/Pel-15E family pectate lyase